MLLAQSQKPLVKFYLATRYFLTFFFFALGGGPTIFVVSVILFSGFLIGFILFQDWLNKKKIASSNARLEALRQEQLKKKENIKMKETPKKEIKNIADKLRDLKKLHDEGVIDDEEFKFMKTNILKEY